MPGCRFCNSSYYYLDNVKKLNYYCSSCHGGLYLYENTTRVHSTDIIYTSCVEDCPTTNSRTINDPNKNKC